MLIFIYHTYSLVGINTQLREDLQERHLTMEVNINTYNMCATNYLGISLIKAFEPAAQVSDLSSKCQAVLFPPDRRSLSEVEFKLDVTWPDSDEETVRLGLISRLFPNLKTKILEYIDLMTQNITETLEESISGYIHEAKREIIENMQGRNGGKAKCNKESSQDQENIFLDEEADRRRRDLEEDDILSLGVAVAVKEKMDELKESMEQIEALVKMEVKALIQEQEMNERLEEKIENKFEAADADEKFEVLEKKMENKFEAADEKFEVLEKKMENKFEMLEKKMERKFDVVDEKMDEIKSMIARLLADDGVKCD